MLNFRLGIESKIVATFTDDGADIRAAIQHAKKFGIRLHCIWHGLNLIVKNGFQLWKEKDEKKKSIDLTG